MIAASRLKTVLLLKNIGNAIWKITMNYVQNKNNDNSY